MTEHHDDHNLFEEIMLTSPFLCPNIVSPPDPLNGVLLKENISEEWLDEMKHFSKAVWID